MLYNRYAVGIPTCTCKKFLRHDGRRYRIPYHTVDSTCRLLLLLLLSPPNTCRCLVSVSVRSPLGGVAVGVLRISFLLPGCFSLWVGCSFEPKIVDDGVAGASVAGAARNFW